MHFNKASGYQKLIKLALYSAFLVMPLTTNAQKIAAVAAQPPVAVPAEAIGKVVLVRGEVYAQGLDQQKRNLKRRSEIFAGDNVITGLEATAQLRMIDGAIFSLDAESELSFDAYRLAQEDQQEKAVMKIIKGGLRTITGSIGHGNSENYELQTNVATIGIRGTTYQIAYESQTTVVAAAWQGGITMSSDKGDIDLGLGAPFNFARLAVGSKPQGLLQPPPLLLNKTPPPATAPNRPQNQNRDDQPQDADPDNTTATVVANDDDPDAGNLNLQARTADTQVTDDSSTTLAGDDLDTSTLDTTIVNAEETTIIANTLATTDTNSTLDASLTQDTTINSANTGTGTVDANSVDPRLSVTEFASLDRLGIVLGSQPCLPTCTPKFGGGMASDGMNGDPIILDNTVPLSDSNFGAFPAPHIIRGDAALAGNLVTNSVGGSSVTWGVWSADINNPIVVQDSLSDATSVSNITQKALFATVTPTDPTLLTGVFRYGPDFPSGGGSVIDFLIESPATNIVGLNKVGFNIDFGTGTIYNGILDFALASGDVIITDFSGTQFGPRLALNFDVIGRDDSIGNPIASYTPGVQDQIGGIVTGANGEGALLGFSFIDQFAGDPIAGFVLLGQGTAIIETRLSSTEMSSIDRVGLMVGTLDPCPPPTTQCSPKLGGGAASDAASGSPIFTNNMLPPGTNGFAAIPPLEVIRPGTSANYIETPITGVSWGVWADTASASSATRTSTVYAQTDPSDPNITQAIDETIFFASVLPTDPSLLTGSFTYSNVLGDFVWTDSGGTLVRTGGISSQFDVNFNTGAISNGSLSLTSPNISATFQGMVATDGGAAYLDLNLIDINGGTPLNQDAISGVFTGANGEFALMSVSLLDPGSATPLVGHYLLGR